jgi:hypothetical protein
MMGSLQLCIKRSALAITSQAYQRGLRILMLTGLLLILALGATASAVCPAPGTPVPLLTLGGPIEKRWRELKCDENLGNPISPERRHLGSGGIYQDFEDKDSRGQIAVHPHWAGDPTAKMANFLMSAHLDGDKIHVFWGDTAPYSYDFFNIRWDRDDHDEAIAKQHEHTGGIPILGWFSSDPSGY